MSSRERVAGGRRPRSSGGVASVTPNFPFLGFAGGETRRYQLGTGAGPTRRRRTESGEGDEAGG